MTVRKFRFNLVDVPSECHRDDGGDTVIKVRFPTKTGLKILTLRDQEIIRTEDDPVADGALLNYRPPKIPIKHHPGGVPSHAYHNYEEHMAKRPFVEVTNTLPYDHVL